MTVDGNIQRAFLDGKLDSAGRPVSNSPLSESPTTGPAAVTNESPLIRRVSIDEACRFVGVSRETMIRFVEAGYFPGAKNPSAGIEASALESIFGVKIPAPKIDPLMTGTSLSAKGASSNSGSSIPETSNETTLVETENEYQSASELDEASDTDVQDVFDATTLNSTASSERPTEEAPFSAVPRRAVSDMYERLIRTLESEISSLKDEREWLKRRVEQFEEKASRDQVLMLSETQMIRELLGKALPASRQLGAPKDASFSSVAASSEASEPQPSAKIESSTGAVLTKTSSPIRTACEWLGLLPSSESK